MVKTIDEKKAELIEAGYLFEYGRQSDTLFIKTPDELLIEYPWMLADENLHIIKAYAHLQDKRKLEILEKLIIEIGNPVIEMWDDYGTFYCVACEADAESYEHTVTHEPDCAWVALQEFNSTSPDNTIDEVHTESERAE